MNTVRASTARAGNDLPDALRIPVGTGEANETVIASLQETL